MKAKSIPRSLLLILLAAVPPIPAALLFAADKPAALDGKTYTGTLLKQGERQGDPDDFVFHDGQFVSTACAGFGFKPATYSLSDIGGKVQFSAQSEAANGVRMVWKGQVDGDHLE